MKRIRSDMAGPKLRRKRGELSREDQRLWAHVTHSAKPLPGRKKLDIPEEPIIPEMNRIENSAIAPPSAAIRKPPALLPLAGIEKRMIKQVARGALSLDRRIDLHGMRQAEAHQALNAFIHQAHHEGARLVLVITGKGGGVDARGEERGVLRRLVPHWLADPLMRRLVIGFESAARGHGGDGALYVRIRRRRETS